MSFYANFRGTVICITLDKRKNVYYNYIIVQVKGRWGRMITIGITGGSGSGKSTAARFLAQQGAKWIDADLVYRSLTDHPTECTLALAEEFGISVLQADGALDRRALAAIVFDKTNKAQEALARLNAITHRYVQEKCEEKLKEFREAGVSVTVLDVPLLFESKMDKLCDVTIAFVAPREVRLERILKRDGITHEAAEARIAAQPNDDYYEKRATYTIKNDGDEGELQSALSDLLPSLTQ